MTYHTRFSLAYRDGWLCVRADSTLDAEPQIVSRYWPIKRATEREVTYHWPEPLGQVLKECSTDTFEHYALGGARVYRLIDGGATKAIAMDFTPAEKPKGIRNAAWEYGKWVTRTQKGKREYWPAWPPLAEAPTVPA